MLKKNRINHMLRFEVAKKGQTATFAFLAFPIFSFFYGYGSVRFLTFIKVTSVVLFVLASIRYFLYAKIINEKSITKKEWFVTVLLVAANGLGNGIILFLAALELKMNGIHYVAVTTMVVGLVGSSMVTLAYSSVLFIPFQIFLLLPQVACIIYLYFFEDINHLPIIVPYVMFFIYQVMQFFSYHRDLVKFFAYQIELEEKNIELKASKEIIIEQTTQLIHSSRLAIVGEISAGIAHEINNPLAIISSSSHLLSRFNKSQEFDNATLARYLGKINKSTERISLIVKGLKYFSSHSDERTPKQNCFIQNIIDETTPFCIDHLNSFDIKFEVNNIPNQIINCHPVQISQVLINLLKNASDALVENEALDKWISINFREEEDYFYFIVSNGGDKISEDVASKIFNPFFSTKHTGTGLGLSISQTIMKGHGGELYLDVNNYSNTTFVVKHPIENLYH